MPHFSIKPSFFLRLWSWDYIILSSDLSEMCVPQILRSMVWVLPRPVESETLGLAPENLVRKSECLGMTLPNISFPGSYENEGALSFKFSITLTLLYWSRVIVSVINPSNFERLNCQQINNSSAVLLLGEHNF